MIICMTSKKQGRYTKYDYMCKILLLCAKYAPNDNQVYAYPHSLHIYPEYIRNFDKMLYNYDNFKNGNRLV